MRKYILYLSAFFGLLNNLSFAERIYDESDSRVVMEMENTESAYDGWDFHATNATNYPAGATGTGHLEFKRYGPGGWGIPHSPLVYKFRVNQAGIYRLFLRAHKNLNPGDSSDQHNDCFIRMEGNFLPGASNITHAALLTDSKIFGGSATAWTRATNLDAPGADHVPTYYEFFAGETYTLVISGRSNQFNLDRIVLAHSIHGWPSDTNFAGWPESDLVYDVLSGDPKLWNKITLSLLGPDTSETAGTNPFSDYRYDVTFSHAGSGKSYTVPGYYAADGDAGNSAASSGDIWNCHFRPDETGPWDYTISFRTGSNVAMGAAGGGVAVADRDGVTGSFTVTTNDQVTAPDFRAKGRLQYVDKHHLQFAGSGEYFLKFGPDSPENFLEYYEFDNTPLAGNKGARHEFTAHADDYNGDGLLWQGTKGSNIFGAVNYIASTGANSISMILNNIGRTVPDPSNPGKTLSTNGDGARAFPYISTNVADRLRFDCSKLDQWEKVFDHAERKGLYLHFKLAEIENARDLDGGALGNERKLYYREMIARFGHHLALNWNISEEIPVGSTTRTDWLEYLEANDPWHNHRVFHTGPSYDKSAFYNPHLGDSELTGISLQTPEATTPHFVFDETKTWVDRSASNSQPWVVACDEQGPGNQGVGAGFDISRKYVLWGNIMAGGGGVEYYWGGRDLNLDDYEEFHELLVDSDHAVNCFFYEENIPFWNMSNNDSLLSANTNAHCLTDNAGTYVVYLINGGTASLNLSSESGTFDVQWFDPRNGGDLQMGSVVTVSGGGVRALGTAPGAASDDWALLVRKQGLVVAPTVDLGQDVFVELPTSTVLLLSSSTDDGVISSFNWTQVSGPSPAGLSGQTTSNLTASGLVMGTYEFELTVTDNDGFIARDSVLVTVQQTFDAVIHPEADVYTLEVNPTVKTGLWNKLQNMGPASKRDAYFRFDLSSLAGENLKTVLLRLKVESRNGNGAATAFVQGVSDDSWVETSTDWNTAPAAGSNVGLAPVAAVGDWVEVDITDYVKSELVGDQAASMQVTTDSATLMYYHAREASLEGDRPHLTVVFNPPAPEPTVLLDEDWETIAFGDTTGINASITDGSYDAGLRLHNHILGEVMNAHGSFSSATGQVMQVTTGTNPSGGWGLLTADNNPRAVSLVEGQDIRFSFDAYVMAAPEGSGSILLKLSMGGGSDITRNFTEFTGASVGDVIRVDWTNVVTAGMLSVSNISPAISFEGLVGNFSTIGPNGDGTELDVMQLDNIQLILGLPPTTNTGFAKFEEDHQLTEGVLGDDDLDGVLNIYEYGLGGNPTNAADMGYLPTLAVMMPSGLVEFHHVILIDPDMDLDYVVEENTNLVSGTWLPASWNLITTNAHPVAGLNEIMLQSTVGGLDARFFRLNITPR